MGVAQKKDIPFVGQIPIDPEVVMAGDARIPLLCDGRQPSGAKAFAGVVGLVLGGNFE